LVPFGYISYNPNYLRGYYRHNGFQGSRDLIRQQVKEIIKSYMGNPGKIVEQKAIMRAKNNIR
jgi:hypothetical protein